MNEIRQEAGRVVVQRLVKLIKFRNEYPAFDGDFTVLESAAAAIHLEWQKNERNCTLHVDLITMKSVIIYVDENGETVEYLV